MLISLLIIYIYIYNMEGVLSHKLEVANNSISEQNFTRGKWNLTEGESNMLTAIG